MKTSGPFSTHHYAIGDLVQWTGIKRCGAAMHMGFLAANNIHQEILVSKGVKKEANYLTFPEVPPMIALACGKEAVSYSVEDGAKVGEDIMDMFFGKDLGFKSKFLIALSFSGLQELQKIGVERGTRGW
jgi:hypothetical protein